MRMGWWMIVIQSEQGKLETNLAICDAARDRSQRATTSSRQSSRSKHLPTQSNAKTHASVCSVFSPTNSPSSEKVCTFSLASDNAMIQPDLLIAEIIAAGNQKGGKVGSSSRSRKPCEPVIRAARFSPRHTQTHTDTHVFASSLRGCSTSHRGL